jgi:primosomal protein N'
MDEEHDGSYNSDKAPRFSSKEVIKKMLEIDSSIHVVFAS